MFLADRLTPICKRFGIYACCFEKNPSLFCILRSEDLHSCANSSRRNRKSASVSTSSGCRSSTTTTESCCGRLRWFKFVLFCVELILIVGRLPLYESHTDAPLNFRSNCSVNIETCLFFFRKRTDRCRLNWTRRTNCPSRRVFPGVRYS